MRLKKQGLLSGRTAIGKRMADDKRYRIVMFASLGFAFNLLYAVYNGILGFLSNSLWLITMCAYYIILSTMRFSAVLSERRKIRTNAGNSEEFIMMFSGFLLVMLSFVLSGSVYLSTKFEVAQKNNEIIMITIATYTFYKTTMAIINFVKIKKTKSPLLITIRNIACADAIASMLSLQRSMLVSFGDVDSPQNVLLNVILGIAVCMFIFILGLSMIFTSSKKKRRE